MPRSQGWSRSRRASAPTEVTMWAQGRRCSTGGRRASTGRAAAAGRSTRWGTCWAVPRGRLPRRAALCSCSCCGWGGGWAPCLTSCWASVQASGVRAPRRASSTAGCSPRPPPPLRSEASASPPMSSPASASPPMSSPPAVGPHPPARSEAGAVRQAQAARDHWKAGARRGGAEGEGGQMGGGGGGAPLFGTGPASSWQAPPRARRRSVGSA